MLSVDGLINWDKPDDRFEGERVPYSSFGAVLAWRLQRSKTIGLSDATSTRYANPNALLGRYCRSGEARRSLLTNFGRY